MEQLTLFDWNDTAHPPQISGFYTVKDRRGRVFDTWYERNRGFNTVYNGAGYTILQWKHSEGRRGECLNSAETAYTLSRSRA